MTEERDATKRSGEGQENPPSKRLHSDSNEFEKEAEALRAMAKIQDELQTIDDECVKEQMQIQKKYDVKKAPFFAQRHEYIDQVPNFWGKALLNHGALDQIVGADKEILNFLKCIDLEDNLDDAGSYKVKFVFSEEASEYFEPLELIKHIVFSDSSTPVVEFVTPITFKNDKDPREIAKKNRKEGFADSWSIFEWFAKTPAYEVSAEEADQGFISPPDLGEIIRRHFWHSPLSYFLNDDSDSDASEHSEGDRNSEVEGAE